MTRHEEAAFHRKAEAHFRGQRPLPNGRDFTCWEHEHQPEADRRYRENFDRAFPDAPGGPGWWEKRMQAQERTC